MSDSTHSGKKKISGEDVEELVNDLGKESSPYIIDKLSSHITDGLFSNTSSDTEVRSLIHNPTDAGQVKKAFGHTGHIGEFEEAFGHADHADQVEEAFGHAETLYHAETIYHAKSLVVTTFNAAANIDITHVATNILEGLTIFGNCTSNTYFN
jgi:hypothetical protein